MNVPLTARQVWGMPALLGVISGIGLFSALLGDGVWDGVSWLALGLPCGIIAWYVIRSGWNKTLR
ncbi:hypothetical protein NITLEN_40051 [Nitrospira lenta]|uniref:DUF4175 domain-containing protein n=1 Tax=Nitrospira lenta TaxID=1436998 RepID=A0A330LF03_9BACT|nr:hypothetical protein NITLEN_40051 [Nitrospira lenta]